MNNESEHKIIAYIQQNRVLVVDGGNEYYKQIVFENNKYTFETEGTGEQWRTLSENEIIDLLFKEAQWMNKNLTTIEELYNYFCLGRR